MISKTYASKILSYICGVSVTNGLSMPKEVYLGFCIGEPDYTTGAVSGEPTAASYGRKLVSGSNMKPALFGEATGGVITNEEEIQFRAVREQLGTMNYFFLSESATGNAFLWGELKNEDGTRGVTINAETVPVFYAGDLKASIDVDLT